MAYEPLPCPPSFLSLPIYLALNAFRYSSFLMAAVTCNCLPVAALPFLSGAVTCLPFHIPYSLTVYHVSLFSHNICYSLTHYFAINVLLFIVLSSKGISSLRELLFAFFSDLHSLHLHPLLGPKPCLLRAQQIFVQCTPVGKLRQEDYSMSLDLATHKTVRLVKTKKMIKRLDIVGHGGTYP